MKIENDIILYKKGDRAAEMRLASFIMECEKNLEAPPISKLISAGGRIALFARAAITRIGEKNIERQGAARIKQKILKIVSDAEAAGILVEPQKGIAIWLPLLKEASSIRWQLKPDQEVYNIDLRIRRMIEIARRIGIRV